MRNKLYWGLGVLIVLMLGVNAFLLLRNTDTEPEKEVHIDVAPDNRHKSPDMIAIENYENKPNDGNEYEWHGDHWHRVPNPDAPRVVDMEFKSEPIESNLPDELPAEFPTDAEIQQMSFADVTHLQKLYRQEADEIRKTDYDAGTRFYNAIMPQLNARSNELHAQSNKRMMESNNRTIADLPIIRPQTEESPAVVIEVVPRSNAESEGGKQ